LWGRIGPPRKAKLQKKSPNPKNIAVWNRLLTVWNRLEPFGTDSKRFAGIWFSSHLFIFERKPQYKYIFVVDRSKL
jgi:hypothetical protein